MAGVRKAKRAAPHGLDRLWAPWRMPYVRGASAPASCLFCSLRRTRDDRAHLVLARRPGSLLMLNRFPYNPAHLMISVARHVARFQDLAPEERRDFLDLTALAERALEREYRPHGMNVGANLGHVAGAGFPGHLHLHVVPRWEGDTNYMPVIGETRVLPESLARTWSRLKQAIREIEGEARGGRKR